MAYKAAMGEPPSASSSNLLLNHDEPAEYRPILLRLAGLLGVAAAAIAILLFLIACAGFGRAFNYASLVPTGLGALSLVLAILGGLIHRRRLVESTHVFAAVFTALLGLLGGLCEVAVWLNWQAFGK